VNHPTPAIVTQAAARRFPRAVLWLLCLAYVLPGFFWRDGWRSSDMASLGFMAELAAGTSRWLNPTLIGGPAENPALLPYWIGAWVMQLALPGVAPDTMVRFVFALLLGVTLLATWFGCYYLARSPHAQPVAFAFGGEALPADYARAMADGGLLAFMACLGLAQLSHETTPALAQLTFAALLFYGVSAMPYRIVWPRVAVVLGALGLALSGAPTLAVLFSVGGAAVHWLDHTADDLDAPRTKRYLLDLALLLLTTLGTALVAYVLKLWLWKVEWPRATWAEWNGYAQLFIWFIWPAWPLALWTLWRWRHQWLNAQVNRHLALPLWWVAVTSAATLTTGSPDRTLLLCLPALSALAAFALPTLKRQVSALIDWFTLLFFSGCGLTIWVVWIAMQTGYPEQPAANVARLAPGFEHSFSFPAFVIAVLATLAWAWLVRWRAGRHRAAIWKSLVLPSGGATLCWLLLMTLWMPLLNYAQSYTLLVQRTLAAMDTEGCVEVQRLNQGQIAAFQWYGKLQLKPSTGRAQCPWLLREPDNDSGAPPLVDSSQWTDQRLIRHPTDANESVWLFKAKDR
jgi:hypothetical protein